MIRPFAARQAEALSHGRYARRLPGNIQRVAQRKLRQLHSAEDLRDLAAPNETDEFYLLFTVTPAKALGHAHIWQPKSPSPPLGAERVGVRWGSPRGRNGGTAHLILPPLPRRAPPSPPASGRRGARARDRMAASRTCVHTLALPRGRR